VSGPPVHDDSMACAKALRGLVHVAGGSFLTAPETYARAPTIGLEPNFDYYIAGRFGVLGDAPVDVIAASAAFVAPALLEPAWERCRRIVPPLEVAAHFAGACHEWGRAHFEAGAAATTVVELGSRVTIAASASAAPLFAGWRHQPRPDDAPAAAALTLHQLRELRMARHVVAITATGLSPLEAIVAGPGGAPNAQMFGWPEPYPEPEPLQPLRDAAEQLTTQLVARDLGVLDSTEMAELVESVRELRDGL
jgi:hypothetical protein